MRRTGPRDGLPVVCVNGGSAAAVPGDWSASMEWLVGRLAPEHPGLAFHEVRYRTKSWNRLPSCIDDCLAALEAAADPAGRRTLLLGFSMGGAVSIGAAGHPSVGAVVGLAPWIPARLRIDGLRGKRLAVIQGSLDGWIPGVPGIRPSSSRAGWERVESAGVPATYTLIRGAIHPIALRWGGRPVPAPRARTWARLVSAELARFQAEEA
jgi:dienelactone hydrolase